MMIVTSYIHPYNQWHELYQRYYRSGLFESLTGAGDQFATSSIARGARLLGIMYRLRYATPLQPLMHSVGFKRPFDRLAAMIGGAGTNVTRAFHHGVGQYLLRHPDGSTRKWCIDACDYGTIPQPAFVEWSDLYFKTNYWPSMPYERRVQPFYNCDPFVLPNIGEFRSMRDTQKSYDICFVARIWGGREETEGVEHCVRMMEGVAKAPGRKFLYACIVAGDFDAIRKRLEPLGVICRGQLLPSRDLWSITARSKLNIVRLGMHYCVPWRVTGALAIGSSIVLDRVPWTLWPEPLRPDEHFYNLDISIGLDRSVGKDEDYEAIPGKIETWLHDAKCLPSIARSAGDYFDRYMTPRAVGDYLLARILQDS